MHMGAPTTKSGRLSMDADSRHRLESDRTASPLNKLVRMGTKKLVRMDTKSLRAVADEAKQQQMVARKKLLQARVHKEAVAGLSVKIHAYSDDDDDDDDDDGPAEASGRPRTATI